MSSPTNGVVLIVDDEEGIRIGLSRFFSRHGYTVLACGTMYEAIDHVEHHAISCAILDVRLESGTEGLDLLTRLRQVDPDMPIIVITGYGRIDDAVEAMKNGARDYLLKPIDNGDLLRRVRREIEIESLHIQNDYFRSEKETKSVAPLLRESRCPEIRRAIDTIDKVKDSSITVLIHGETGTGKEIFAQYLHYTSTRRDNPLVSVNCAALSDELLLSELFGHEKGAFTGATERRRGRFEIADGGTLFLDEIGDLSLDIQAKLLRVLEESRFERLGGSQSVAVDVRIVTATNKNLPLLVEKGQFRSDLYFRLNVVNIDVPPLRARRGDIPLLVDRFVTQFNSQHGKNITEIPDSVLNQLCTYSWPGNIRELKNVISQSVLLSDDQKLTLYGFAAPSSQPETRELIDFPDVHHDLKSSVQYYIGEIESGIIGSALERHNGNRSATARHLGVTRKTLRDKMHRYGLDGGGTESTTDDQLTTRTG